jgi:hypothetical protein
MREYQLTHYFEFGFPTHTTAGAVSDADSLPTWRVYEENNDTVIASGTCAKRDDANTTGYYYARGQITAVAGYEAGKVYEVRVKATVGGVTGSGVVGEFIVVPADVTRDDQWTDDRAGSLDQIPKNLGTWRFVDGTNGDDTNSGLYPDDALATVAAAISASSAGDHILVAAGVYDEAGLDINVADLELRGEQGVVLGGNGGTCLTISANDVCIEDIHLTPQTGAQKGLVITGEGAEVEHVKAEGCTVSFDVDGDHNELRNCESHEHTTTAFDIAGAYNEVEKCLSSGAASGTRGFWCSAAGADHNEFLFCVSVADDTSSFETEGGADNNSFAWCAADADTRQDDGTDTMWSGFAEGMVGLAGGAVTLEDDAITADKIADDAIDADALALSAIAELWANAGNGTNACDYTFVDGDGNAAGGIRVDVYSDDGGSADALVAWKTTDTSGVVDFKLALGTYHLVTPSTVDYESSDTTVTVNGDETQTITLTAHSVATPPTSDYCVVRAFENSVANNKASGTLKVTRVHSPETDGSGATTVSIVSWNDEDEADFDSDGLAEISLLRGAVITLKAELDGAQDIVRTKRIVPDADSVNWEKMEVQS